MAGGGGHGRELGDAASPPPFSTPDDSLEWRRCFNRQQQRYRSSSMSSAAADGQELDGVATGPRPTTTGTLILRSPWSQPPSPTTGHATIAPTLTRHRRYSAPFHCCCCSSSPHRCAKRERKRKREVRERKKKRK